MRISHLLLAASLLASTAAASAFAAGPHGWGGHGDPITRGLTLSDTQKQQVRSIEKAAHVQARATVKQLFAIREQIMTQLLSSPSVTEADLTPLVQQADTLKATLDQERLATALQIRQVLTPAQLSQAATLHQQLQALHQQEHQLMGHEGAPQ
jgi:Spy/CpxP family protein refolding chaperone